MYVYNMIISITIYLLCIYISSYYYYYYDYDDDYYYYYYHYWPGGLCRGQRLRRQGCHAPMGPAVRPGEGAGPRDCRRLRGGAASARRLRPLSHLRCSRFRIRGLSVEQHLIRDLWGPPTNQSRCPDFRLARCASLVGKRP